jgi:hypothetical protein
MGSTVTPTPGAYCGRTMGGVATGADHTRRASVTLSHPVAS